MAYKKREPMDNLEYLELVRQTAARTFLPEQTVRLVLEGLIKTMEEALSERKRIILRDFGSLRLMLRYNSRLGRYAVTVFRMALGFRDRLAKEMNLNERKEGRRDGEVRGSIRGQGQGG